MRIAATGKLDCVVVINDIDLANRLALGLGRQPLDFAGGKGQAPAVRYVVYRPVMGVGDTHDAPFGDERDISRGKVEWYNAPNQIVHHQLDSRVYIQLYGHNERNYPNDGYWYLGIQQAAATQGRKLAIFGDGVGHPADLNEVNGKAVSACWSLRVSSGCMRFGKAAGNLACLHQYGRMVNGKETSDPGSAIWSDGRHDDEAYRWFGGRHAMVWRDLIPEDSRMQIVVGECGPSDAIYRGVDALLSDMKGYSERYMNDPHIAAYAYWSVGRGGGDPGDFAYSAFDDALPMIFDYLAAQVRGTE